VVGVGQLTTTNEHTERSVEGCVFDDNDGAGDCAVTTAGRCQSR
jgi:hypothetical protein